MLTPTQREALTKRNEKLIQAVLQRAELYCPGALELLGVNGSYLTGDLHPLSDLDLLIVMREGQEDKGALLSETFIQDDLFVGHDFYCYGWDRLEAAAEYRDPYIAKLMDVLIVYAADAQSTARLEALREKAQQMLEEISAAADVPCADVMRLYQPENLFAAAEGYTAALEPLLSAYAHVGLQVDRYADIDEMIQTYTAPPNHIDKLPQVPAEEE